MLSLGKYIDNLKNHQIDLTVEDKAYDRNNIRKILEALNEKKIKIYNEELFYLYLYYLYEENKESNEELKKINQAENEKGKEEKADLEIANNEDIVEKILKQIEHDFQSKVEDQPRQAVENIEQLPAAAQAEAAAEAYEQLVEGISLAGDIDSSLPPLKVLDYLKPLDVAAHKGLDPASIALRGLYCVLLVGATLYGMYKAEKGKRLEFLKQTVKEKGFDFAVGVGLLAIAIIGMITLPVIVGPILAIAAGAIGVVAGVKGIRDYVKEYREHEKKIEENKKEQEELKTLKENINQLSMLNAIIEKMQALAEAKKINQLSKDFEKVIDKANVIETKKLRLLLDKIQNYNLDFKLNLSFEPSKYITDQVLKFKEHYEKLKANIPAKYGLTDNLNNKKFNEITVSVDQKLIACREHIAQLQIQKSQKFHLIDKIGKGVQIGLTVVGIAAAGLAIAAATAFVGIPLAIAAGVAGGVVGLGFLARKIYHYVKERRAIKIREANKPVIQVSQNEEKPAESIKHEKDFIQSSTLSVEKKLIVNEHQLQNHLKEEANHPGEEKEEKKQTNMPAKNPVVATMKHEKQGMWKDSQNNIFYGFQHK